MLAYDSKPRILDAMKIITNMWNKDRKYARSNGIQRCWRKTGIFIVSWNTDLNNDVGSESLPAWYKNMSDKDCNNICRMLMMMYVKVNESNADMNSTACEL